MHQIETITNDNIVFFQSFLHRCSSLYFTSYWIENLSNSRISLLSFNSIYIDSLLIILNWKLVQSLQQHHSFLPNLSSYFYEKLTSRQHSKYFTRIAVCFCYDQLLMRNHKKILKQQRYRDGDRCPKKVSRIMTSKDPVRTILGKKSFIMLVLHWQRSHYLIDRVAEVPHTPTSQSNTYVLNTERIFDSRPFMYVWQFFF